MLTTEIHKCGTLPTQYTVSGICTWSVPMFWAATGQIYGVAARQRRVRVGCRRVVGLCREFRRCGVALWSVVHLADGAIGLVQRIAGL